MGEYDAWEKTLMEHNEVFVDIVNGLYFKGTQRITVAGLTEETNNAIFKKRDGMSARMRDVTRSWRADSSKGSEAMGINIAYFGIENQTAIDYDMPLRNMAYDAATYDHLYNNADKQFCPVFTLVLNFGTNKWTGPKTLSKMLPEPIPEWLKPYFNDYHINVFDIRFLPVEAIEWFHSDFKYLVDYLVKSRINKSYKPKHTGKIKHIYELMNLLALLTKDSSWTDVLNRWDEEGDLENMEQVVRRMDADGREQATLEYIRNLMESLNLTVEEAMDALKVPLDEREALKAKL